MISTKFDVEKAKAATLFILNNLGGKCGFRHTFKILYFADQMHLAKYGRPIVEDKYIAMENGPVPTKLYDAVKAIRGDRDKVELFSSFYDGFNVLDKGVLEAIESPDMDELSQSDVTCLRQSIEENGYLGFNKISDKSHDSAWKTAGLNKEMSLVEIAVAGGAGEAEVDYVKEYIERKHLCF